MFVGREKELEELNRLYKQDRFQLFILYGRRRVGKTTLLNEFCRSRDSIFYAAEQTNDKMNLEKFSAEVFRFYGEEHVSGFSNWEKAFLYINERQRDRQLVVVLDEFPYLADSNPALMSVLQHLIDHQLKDGKLFLILCGSYMGFMEKEVLSSKSPLFGRRTAQLHMKPFLYTTGIRMLPGFSGGEKLMLYSIYGGTPLYLRQIDNETGFEDNIRKDFLTPTGYLYEEPMLLMRQEVQKPGMYCAVIEAIAGGAVRSAEIAARTGEETAKCLKYISVLRELGILYREVPFGEKENSRKAQYGICDPMFRFWYRYVSPNKTLLETGAERLVWTKRIAPDLSHYMGTAFEMICREYLLLKNSRGELPVLFTKIGRWWGTDPEKRKETEIDLIAEDGEDYLICECKWRNELTDRRVYEELKQKADVFRKRRHDTWYVLFSKSGFSSGLIQEARNDPRLLLVTLEELLALSAPPDYEEM